MSKVNSGSKPKRGLGPRLTWLLATAAFVACGVPGSNGASAQIQNPPAASPTEPGATTATARIDVQRMLADIEYLASDELGGRRAGTEGNALARNFLDSAFGEIGLRPFGSGYTKPFSRNGAQGGDPVGVNVVGYIAGSETPDRYIVITAHFDHLGTRDGQIYNGADDNASGTAALLALARYFQANTPAHSIIFAALDAEEQGLLGARAFVADPPVPLQAIAINVNMDMVSRNERGELYVAGTYHYPFLTPLVARVAESASVRLLAGHDRPGLPPGQDWTAASDHGAFHDVGIPFLYFGVEDHADYHRPTDTFENIDPDFYARAIETVLDAVLELDRNLATLPDRVGDMQGAAR